MTRAAYVAMRFAELTRMNRDERLCTASAIVGREIKTFSDLMKLELDRMEDYAERMCLCRTDFTATTDNSRCYLDLRNA